MFLSEDASFGFLRAADLTDHQHGIRLGILLESFEDIAMRRTVDRIAADTDRRRDADAEFLQLRGGLVAESSRTADDANATWKIDVPRHDAEHRLAGRNRAGAVRPGQDHTAFFLVAPHV